MLNFNHRPPPAFAFQHIHLLPSKTFPFVSTLSLISYALIRASPIISALRVGPEVATESFVSAINSKRPIASSTNFFSPLHPESSLTFICSGATTLESPLKAKDQYAFHCPLLSRLDSRLYHWRSPKKLGLRSAQRSFVRHTAHLIFQVLFLGLHSFPVRVIRIDGHNCFRLLLGDRLAQGTSKLSASPHRDPSGFAKRPVAKRSG